jgi:hypothetical protein
MNSSIIGKIEKARRYAAEPERVKFTTLDATFHGDNDEYTMTLHDGQWHCTCHFFTSQEYGSCAHIMAMQRLLAPMLSDEARYEQVARGAAVAAVGD